MLEQRNIYYVGNSTLKVATILYRKPGREFYPQIDTVYKLFVRTLQTIIHKIQFRLTHIIRRRFLRTLQVDSQDDVHTRVHILLSVNYVCGLGIKYCLSIRTRLKPKRDSWLNLNLSLHRRKTNCRLRVSANRHLLFVENPLIDRR